LIDSWKRADTISTGQPKLILTFDAIKDGEQIDTKISPETRKLLEQLSGNDLAKLQDLNEDQITKNDGMNLESGDAVQNQGHERMASLDTEPQNIRTDQSRKAGHKVKMIEIPLKSDLEFFKVLNSELQNLHELQGQQKQVLGSDIVQLGQEVGQVSAPLSVQSKSDIYPWREIFRIYLEAGVFFSPYEHDHGKRSAEKANERLEWCSQEIKRLKLVTIANYVLALCDH